MSCGVIAYTLQNVAVVGMMSVRHGRVSAAGLRLYGRWTPFFKSTTSSMGIFLLDIKSLSVGCLTGVACMSPETDQNPCEMVTQHACQTDGSLARSWGPVGVRHADSDLSGLRRRLVGALGTVAGAAFQAPRPSRWGVDWKRAGAVLLLDRSVPA